MFLRLLRKLENGAQKQQLRSYIRNSPFGGRPFLRPNGPRNYGMKLDIIMLKYIKRRNYLGAKRIQDAAISQGVFVRNEDLAVLLIELYGKNKMVSDAREVFDSLQRPSTFACHFLIQAYLLTGDLEAAREIYQQTPSISEGTRNMMIGAYLDRDQLDEAKQLFDRKKVPDMVSWSLLFSAFVKKDLLDEAQKMLARVPKRVDVAWNTMLQAYCKKGYLREARETFDSMPGKNVLSYRMMIYAYARRGHLVEARELMKQMEEIDSVLWNEMIQIYAQSGKLREAEDMMRFLRLRTTMASLTCVIQAYGRLGNVERARTIFEALDSPDTVAKNSMLTVFARNGQVSQAREIFDAMPERNEVTWRNMILGCAQFDHLEEARKLLEESPYACVVSSTAVVAAYARRGGQLLNARQLFESLKLKNVVTWTVMIGGYAQNSFPNQALGLFRSMEQEGVAPDAFAFTAILTACRHVGQLENGRSYFRSMLQDYGVRPEIEHFHCMIDILGQAAQLDQAEELINTMPFIPDATSWTSFLGSCKMHGDFERAKRVTKRTSGPMFSSPYVLLSNLYATSSYTDEPLEPSSGSDGDYGMPMGHLFLC